MFRRGAFYVAQLRTKKKSVLVESLSQIAKARTTTLTTTIFIIVRVETRERERESTNEPFKYAKYITRT